MEVSAYTYRVDELNLHPEDIEKGIGYEPGKSPEPVRQWIEEALDRAPDICDIQGGVVILEEVFINRETHKIKIQDTELDVKKIIANQIRKSESLALFLCTAGQGIGDYSELRMQQGDLLEGYIMDLVGSEIVEAAMDKMQDELEQQLLPLGLRMTNRYSPGYCGWSVAEQQKLFSFFPDKFCGITLTPSSLMQPIKSVSGIIGIGREVSRKGYACHICEMAHCIYRKKK